MKLAGSQISVIVQLTNIFETSHCDFDFAVCTQLQDGHGYSAGIIQFTTGTGSAQAVIDEYTEQVNPNEFTAMKGVLEDIAAQTKSDPTQVVQSTVGLESFCSAWQDASKKKEFQDAQIKVLGTNYFIPAEKLAVQIGLTTAVSIGQVYDSCIQIGSETTDKLLQQVCSQMGQPTSENERAWIGAFLEKR